MWNPCRQKRKLGASPSKGNKISEGKPTHAVRHEVGAPHRKDGEPEAHGHCGTF